MISKGMKNCMDSLRKYILCIAINRECKEIFARQYVIIPSLIPCVIDVKSIAEKRCPYCGRRFRSLKRHLLMDSDSCAIEFALDVTIICRLYYLIKMLNENIYKQSAVELSREIGVKCSELSIF